MMTRHNLGLDRDLSKAYTFMHMMHELIGSKINTGTFAEITSHLFVNDLPNEQRASITAELIEKLIRANKMFHGDFKEVAHTLWARDLYSAQVRDLCKVAFDAQPEGVTQEATCMQMLNAMGETTADFPVWLGKGVFMVYFPWDRDAYTPEEQTQILEEACADASRAFEDAKVKVQHMRNGENW